MGTKELAEKKPVISDLLSEAEKCGFKNEEIVHGIIELSDSIGIQDSIGSLMYYSAVIKQSKQSVVLNIIHKGQKCGGLLKIPFYEFEHFQKIFVHRIKRANEILLDFEGVMKLKEKYPDQINESFLAFLIDEDSKSLVEFGSFGLE